MAVFSESSFKFLHVVDLDMEKYAEAVEDLTEAYRLNAGEAQQRRNFDHMCSHLKLILGGGPGTKISKLAGQVKVEASSEEEGVFWTSSGERLVLPRPWWWWIQRKKQVYGETKRCEW